MTLEPELRHIVEKALAGDKDAFEGLIHRYARRVYAQAFAILGDHQTSEDVAQETFLKAYTFRVTLRDPEKFPSWLFSIARNLARDVIRRKRPHLPLSEAPAETTSQPESAAPDWRLETAERLRIVRTALAGLPDRHRKALELRYFQDMDYRSIQHDMGISNGALRGILGRALGGLRRKLKSIGFE